MTPALASLQTIKLECRDVWQHHLESLALKCLWDLVWKPSFLMLEQADVAYGFPSDTDSLG